MIRVRKEHETLADVFDEVMVDMFRSSRFYMEMALLYPRSEYATAREDEKIDKQMARNRASRKHRIKFRRPKK